MKKLSIYALIIGVAASCRNNGTADFVSGTYVRHTTDEFGQLWDTLDIIPVSGTAKNSFHVIEKSAVLNRKLDDTAWLPVKYKQEQYTGTFHPDANTLEIEEKGVRYTLDKTTGRITTWEVSYSRLK